MSDDYQIEIPPSFQALYVDARRRLTVPLATLRQRYELCEDLAQQLEELARQLHFAHDQSEDDTLAQLRLGLSSPDAAMEPAEVGWVIRRQAELLGWTLAARDIAN